MSAPGVTSSILAEQTASDVSADTPTPRVRHAPRHTGIYLTPTTVFDFNPLVIRQYETISDDLEDVAANFEQ